MRAPRPNPLSSPSGWDDTTDTTATGSHPDRSPPSRRGSGGRSGTTAGPSEDGLVEGSSDTPLRMGRRSKLAKQRSQPNPPGVTTPPNAPLGVSSELDRSGQYSGCYAGDYAGDSTPIEDKASPKLVGWERAVAPGIAGHQPVLEKTMLSQIAVVNRLSSELEAALFELRAMLYRPGGGEGRMPQPVVLWQDGELSWIPQVERCDGQTYQVTHRQVDMARAEREAASTAQLLRRLSNQRSREPIAAPSASSRPVLSPTDLDEELGEDRSPVSLRSEVEGKSGLQSGLGRILGVPSSMAGILNDALSWIVVAAGVRFGFHVLMVHQPTIWPVMLLGVTGVLGFGVYQAFLVPSLRLLTGYRLTLMVIGLLLGGRFWSG